MRFDVIFLLIFRVVCFMLINGLIEINKLVSVIGIFNDDKIRSVVNVVLLLILVILKELMVMIVIIVIINIGLNGFWLIVGVIIIVSIVG